MTEPEPEDVFANDQMRSSSFNQRAGATIDKELVSTQAENHSKLLNIKHTRESKLFKANIAPRIQAQSQKQAVTNSRNLDL